MAFSVAMSVVKEEFAAEEVVQEAFLKAFKALASFNQQAKFSFWLYRIVLNEAYEKLKKMKREMHSYTENYNADLMDESTLLTLKADEQSYLVNTALNKLPPRESVALRLFYLQEESIKEVCVLTGWTEANTRVILHRAKNNILKVVNSLFTKEF